MVALIPARGGSKGIPGKNINLMHGRPLIAHTIEAARAARKVHRVVVSTDSEEIAAAAMAAGAEVPFMRPAELAQDGSLAIDAYLDAVARLQAAGEKLADFCVLQPTSPLRLSLDIDEAITQFEKRSADSVISVCEAPHPLAWFRRIDKDGVLRVHETGKQKPGNRQDEETMYVPNGAIFVLRTDFIKRREGYYSDATFAYVMPADRSVDIDVPFDWRIAELLLGERGKRTA